jgi:hypothetical protein
MDRTDSVKNILSTAVSPVRRVRDAGCRWTSILRVSLWLTCLACVLPGGDSFGQPPGTYPPPELVRPLPTPPKSGKIPIKGFLFLDASGNPVLEPRMTYERLQELESGANNQTRRFVFDGVKIDGRVEGNRAELTVEIRVEVDRTGEETIEIPLAMENFHRLGPIEFFSGAEDGNKLAIAVDQDSGDSKLLASVRQDTVVGIRMQMSARVETDSVHSLDFRLPPSPTIINLASDSREVVGQIPNRDDEVIETTTDEAGRSRFKVESSGGRFTLQWGRIDRPVSEPLLEATSGISMQWNSPQDQLILNVRMTVRDARGPISSFRLRLPKDATLRDDPKLITSGQFGQLVEYSRPDPEEKELVQITIPRVERRQSVALEFRVEIPSDSPSAKRALLLEIPVVVDAIRNQGTIDITTGADNRLRWRQRSYIKNTSSVAVEDAAVDQRVYSFQFIRGSFKLPVWLEATKRELRVVSDCEVELRERYANLTMEIRATGNENRAQLLSVDLADWQTPRIENARTGAALPWYESDGLIEIEVNYTAMEENAPVLIRASRALEIPSVHGQDQRVDLRLPRVVGSGDRRDPVTIQEALVGLTGKGRRSLVVDLEQSTNLERVVADDSVTSESTRRFAVMPPESEARIVGALVLQPPRLKMEATATSTLDGDRLETVVMWKIETQVDLEGRLRIAIPDIRVLGEEDSAKASYLSTVVAEALAMTGIDPKGIDPVARSGDAAWTVSVNQRRAQLRLLPSEDSGTDAETNSGGQRVANRPSDEQAIDQSVPRNADRAKPKTTYYELVSDSLTDGTMELVFRRITPVQFDPDSSEALVEIGLPYPLVQDITLSGKVEIELVGDDEHDVTPTEKSLTDQLAFRSLPKKMIPLRLSPRAPAQSELVTDRIVVRSAISEVSQHDQLVANLAGTGEFELQLRFPDQTDIQVMLNGVPAAYKSIDNRLVVGIPAGSEGHVIDVRMWMDRTSRGLFQTVQPLAHVGPGAGQLYWQLIVPADSHLVWTTPSVGREMQWGFDRWRLIRSPLLTETELVSRVASVDVEDIELSPMPKGNRYLFSAMDDRSFRVMTGSRTILWMIVAGLIILVTALLTYIPASRTPLSFVIAIVCFTGLLSVAPDAAILVGQVAMLALVLVVVMLAIRSLVLPTPSRVLTSTRDGRRDSSTQSRRPSIEYRPPSSVAMTHSIGPEDITSTHDEVAS